MAQDNYWRNICDGEQQVLDTADSNCNNLTGFVTAGSVNVEPIAQLLRARDQSLFLTLWQDELLEECVSINIEDFKVNVTLEVIGSE